MKNRGIVKTIFCAALCAVMTLATTGIATADVEIFQNDKIALKLYGQINRAVMYVDDGDDGEFYHVDNDNSSTRLGLKALSQMNDKFSVGANLEFEYQSNPSNAVWQDEANTSGDEWDERKIEAFIKGAFGKLTLGQGSTASDNTSEIDLSGTKVAGYSRVDAQAGAFRFFDEDGNALSSVRVTDIFKNLDGFSRKDRVRYDSPKFSGFAIAVSAASDEGDDAEDVALTYKGKLGNVKAAAGLAYVHFSSSDAKKNQVNGSASFLMENGLNLTVAAGNLEFENSGKDDGTFVYGKLGYIAKVCPLGTTAFAIDYGKYDDMKADEDEGDTVGFTCVQKLQDWKTEIYLCIRHFELDREGSNFDDVDSAMAGLRIKF